MNEFITKLEHDAFFLAHILIVAVLTLVMYYYFNRFMGRKIKIHLEDEHFDATNSRFIQRALGVTIILVGFSFVIFMIPNLKHIAMTILAGAGVLVAVIGFASQQVLSNLISGIMIVTTKPYRLKDRVSVKGMYGIVEDITLRHTVIKNYENKRIITPNSVMSAEVLINSNFAEDICCEYVEMAISYTANIKKTKTIMKEEIIAHPLFIDHRKYLKKDKDSDVAPIRVINVGDFSITLRAWTWTANPGDAFVMGCELLENIKERFDTEGIEIPYPYNNVIWKKNKPE
jgi:small-conductance mechanosensitive channel